MHAMLARVRSVLLLLCLGAGLAAAPVHDALSAETRFLSFAAELQRARLAVGNDAECRVLIEEISAICYLDAVGEQSLDISFADVTQGLVPRRALTITRNRMDPARLTAILNTYGIPVDVTSRCALIRADDAASHETAYVGDFLLSCDSQFARITHARRF